jgi:large subunit ribosomal protein L35
MPKLKTNRGAAKRFRTTKNGKLKRSKAYGRHLLAGKSPKRKRKLHQAALISPEDATRVSRMLPYGSK